MHVLTPQDPYLRMPILQICISSHYANAYDINLTGYSFLKYFNANAKSGPHFKAVTKVQYLVWELQRFSRNNDNRRGFLVFLQSGGGVQKAEGLGETLAGVRGTNLLEAPGFPPLYRLCQKLYPKVIKAT
jgi:hypothetical protein